VFQFSGVQVILFAGIRICIDGIPFLHARPHLVVPHHHHIQNTQALKCELILAQESHALVGILGYIPGGRLQFARENLHEG
jgi:hypothetical protein